MTKVSKKHFLNFPPIKIDKEKLFLEFAPRIYFEKRIATLESDYKVFIQDESSCSRNVRLAMIQGSIENCKLELGKILNKENQIYKEIYREPIKQTEKRSERGDNVALMRLIKWDKRYLFKEWVKNRILISIDLGDRKFITDISNAIRVMPKKSPQFELILFLRQLKSAGYNFNDKKKIKELWKFLYDHFSELAEFKRLSEEHKVFNVLANPEYFNKFLIRHKIRKKRFRKDGH